MNNSLNTETSITYKEIFLNAFPEVLKDDVIIVLGILPLNINTIPFTSSELTVKFNNNLLNIPYRIHFNKPYPSVMSQLTRTQKIILNCIYLRHHDGYVRQRRLEELAGVNENWIIPHTLQLLGEYVLEILQILNKVITHENIQYYRQFIKDNPKYWRQTVSRMISYWDCYYRRKGFQHNRQRVFPILKDYPGKQIIDRLENKT
jgi:hypothetical protein